jgi:hypothetical protein
MNNLSDQQRWMGKQGIKINWLHSSDIGCDVGAFS